MPPAERPGRVRRLPGQDKERPATHRPPRFRLLNGRLTWALLLARYMRQGRDVAEECEEFSLDMHAKTSGADIDQEVGMQWIAENWVAIVVFIAFIALHFWGHGGHGGHGAGRSKEPPGRDAAARNRSSAHRH